MRLLCIDSCCYAVCAVASLRVTVLRSVVREASGGALCALCAHCASVYTAFLFVCSVHTTVLRAVHTTSVTYLCAFDVSAQSRARPSPAGLLQARRARRVGVSRASQSPQHSLLVERSCALDYFAPVPSVFYFLDGTFELQESEDIRAEAGELS